MLVLVAVLLLFLSNPLNLHSCTRRDHIEDGNTLVEATMKLTVVDEESAEEEGAGLIEWLKGISLDDLEAVEVPAIIPGINDFINDDVVNEVDGKVKKSKVKASRGVRGAAKIAAAAKGALDNINKQMRMKEGADKESYSRECFMAPC